MNSDCRGSNLSLWGGLNCQLLSPWCSRWWAPSSAQTPAAWRLQSCRRWSNPLARTWPPPPPRPASAGWMLRSVTESEANGPAHSSKNLKQFHSISFSAQCDCNQREIIFFQLYELIAYKLKACWWAQDDSLSLYFVSNKFSFKPIRNLERATACNDEA